MVEVGCSPLVEVDTLEAGASVPDGAAEVVSVEAGASLDGAAEVVSVEAGASLDGAAEVALVSEHGTV